LCSCLSRGSVLHVQHICIVVAILPFLVILWGCASIWRCIRQRVCGPSIAFGFEASGGDHHLGYSGDDKGIEVGLRRTATAGAKRENNDMLITHARDQLLDEVAPHVGVRT